MSTSYAILIVIILYLAFVIITGEKGRIFLPVAFHIGPAHIPRPKEHSLAVLFQQLLHAYLPGQEICHCTGVFHQSRFQQR